MLKPTVKECDLILPEESFYTKPLGINPKKLNDILKLTKYLKNKNAVNYYKSIKGLEEKNINDESD